MTNDVKYLVLLELVAPEDPSKRLISEEESNELHDRFKAQDMHKPDWKYVFGAIKDEGFKQKMIDLFSYVK